MASYAHCPATSAPASSSTMSSYVHPMLSCREETEDDIRVSRVELMKQRYAGLIKKAQETLSGQTTGGEKDVGNDLSSPTIRKESAGRAVLPHPTKRGKTIQVVADDVGMREREAEREARKIKIQKQREAARRELEQMRDTIGFNDSMEALRDFEKLIGYRVTGGYTCWPIPETFSPENKAQCLDKHKHSAARGHELLSASGVEHLKNRYAGIVDKANQTTLHDADNRKRKRSDQVEQHRESATKNARRKLEKQKTREVARMGMEQMRNTCDAEELEEGELRE